MNDQAAFAELRRRHQSDATRTARIVAHDTAEADRVVDAAFAHLNAALTAGGGPRSAVSPYLRTMIRRGTLDAHRAASEEYEAADPAAVEDLPHTTDPLTAVEERNVIREAYESLPERWQRALWFTEIEGRMPATLVPDLGSAARAVAAMAYRAREGLRQAYLAVHMSVAVSAECQPIVATLPAYVREALSPEDDVTVAIHLDTCVDCRNRRYELLLLVSNLRNVLAPALLGYRAGTPAATRPVAGRGGAAAARIAARRVARTSAVAAMTAVRWPHRAIKVAATAAVCVLTAAALVWAASSAFAPTTSADAAGGDRDEPLAVTFEHKSEPPPAVTLNPLDLLDGVPEENEDDPDRDESATDANAASAGEEPAASDDTGQDEPAADADDAADNEEPAAAADSDDNTSGSVPEDSSTTDSAGGGAAAGAGGGSSGSGAGSGGNMNPPNGSDSGPGDTPVPPTGNDDDSDNEEDEPTVPDDNPDKGKQGAGRIESFLCEVLALLC